MTREDILQLAFSKATTAQEAMALAREMDAFLAGDAAATPKEDRPPCITPIVRSPRVRKHWTAEEIELLKVMVAEGRSYKSIGQRLKRSAQAVYLAHYKFRTDRDVGPQS